MARLLQGATNAFDVVVLAIPGRTGLLTPRFRDRPCIDGIKADLVDQAHHRAFRIRIVARYGKGDATGRPRRLAVFQEMCRIDRIKGLNDGTPDPSLDPSAFRRARFDVVDAAITLLRIIVAGIDDDQTRRGCGEKSRRQIFDALERNGNDDDVVAARCLLCGDGARTRFTCEVLERRRAT